MVIKEIPSAITNAQIDQLMIFLLICPKLSNTLFLTAKLKKMPLVEINISKGNDKGFLLQLMNETMKCIQETLQLPEDDSNIRLSEYDADLFQMKAPYKILIQISMFSGRTIKTKKKLYELLVDNLNKKLQISPKEVFILINEQPRENWGVRGGTAASNIQLDYNVEV